MAPAGLLQTLPIPDLVWEDIFLDFVTRLPSNQGKTLIMVVVDQLSKYGLFNPLSTGFTSQIVANIFVKEIVLLHGFQIRIVYFSLTFGLNCFDSKALSWP